MGRRNASIESIGMHEAGHAIESLLIVRNPAYDSSDARRAAWNNSMESRRIVMIACNNLGIAWSDERSLMKALGKNSGNAKHDPSETMADAIADYCRNQAKSQELSKEIVRLVLEQLR